MSNSFIATNCYKGMKFRVMVKTADDTDWVYNGPFFNIKDEAKIYAKDLVGRSIVSTQIKIVKVPNPLWPSLPPSISTEELIRRVVSGSYGDDTTGSV